MTDGPTERASVGRNPGKILRSITLESEDTACEVLREHSLCCCQPAVAALAFAQQFNSVEDFSLGGEVVKSSVAGCLMTHAMT